MRISRLWLLSVIMLVTLAFSVSAQKPKPKKPVKKPATEKKTTQKKTTTNTQSQTKKPAEQKKTSEPPKNQPAISTNKATGNATEDEKKVRDIIAFLEYMLNTLGSSGTSTRDKEVLVTESYSKVFRDSKVQVEDDLDAQRQVITNKDVVAYLKDVDFFFNDVRFEFNIEGIESGTISGDKQFYKVSTRRVLKGTNSEGEPVTNTSPRFIEINYDPQLQDLKIVSMYTNQFNEKGALQAWWKTLSFEWQGVFRKKLNLKDSVTASDLQRLTGIDELDVSNNEYIVSIEPLTQLVNLRTLNISKTSSTDLTPIRNLTELVTLNISNTEVDDLTPLKYSSNMMTLDLSNTRVTDISVVEKMPKLERLYIRGLAVNDYTALSTLTNLKEVDMKSSKISDLSPLENLTQLTLINAAQTPITGLNPLKPLKNLTELNIDSTRINSIAALSSSENLKILRASHTMISDLKPLQSLAKLERVYCDQTPINRATADAFMASHPKVLVVFDSKDMKTWWDGLADQWKEVIGKAAGFGLTPTKEELARVVHLDSINFSGNKFVTDLEPIRILTRLRVLDASKTGIKDLAPIDQHKELRVIDISDTEVLDISVLSKLTKLEVVRADNCKMEKIDPLFALPNLKTVYADHTTVHDIIAQEFLEKQPKALIVYKTVHLKRWWGNLSESWKNVFIEQSVKDTTQLRESLHRLVEQTNVQIKDVPVADLTALSEFVRPVQLMLSGTAVTDITPIANFKTLRSLSVANSPLHNITSLKQLTELEKLDISNTPIDDLEPVAALQNLKKFNVAGTQVKRLDPLEKLQKLEELDCSNTFVNRLDPVAHLPLKTLKCYNTKISTRKIEEFKSSHPNTNVIYYR
jgi:Leucine-rich repeat (LRR) protein